MKEARSWALIAGSFEKVNRLERSLYAMRKRRVNATPFWILDFGFWSSAGYGSTSQNPRSKIQIRMALIDERGKRVITEAEIRPAASGDTVRVDDDAIV